MRITLLIPFLLIAMQATSSQAQNVSSAPEEDAPVPLVLCEYGAHMIGYLAATEKAFLLKDGGHIDDAIANVSYANNSVYINWALPADDGQKIFWLTLPLVRDPENFFPAQLKVKTVHAHDPDKNKTEDVELSCGIMPVFLLPN